MVFFLQALVVLVAAMLALAFALMVVGPALGGVFHGRFFRINPWHAVAAGVLGALAVALAVAFGWVSAP